MSIYPDKRQGTVLCALFIEAFFLCVCIQFANERNERINFCFSMQIVPYFPVAAQRVSSITRVKFSRFRIDRIDQEDRG